MSKLNERGCLCLSCATVAHAMQPFHIVISRKNKQLETTQKQIDKEYMRRKIFLTDSILPRMVADLMDRDWPRMQKSLIGKLDTEYIKAAKFIGNYLGYNLNDYEIEQPPVSRRTGTNLFAGV